MIPLAASGPIPPLPSLPDLLERVAFLSGAPISFLIAVTAALTILLWNWRFALLALAGHYIIMLFPLSLHLPADWATLRLISGSLAAIMLFLAAQRVKWGAPLAPSEVSETTVRPPFPQPMAGLWVRAVLFAMAALAFSALRPTLPLPDVPPGIVSITLWLAVVGAIGLALGDDPFHNTLALLLWLSGAGLLLATTLQSATIIGIIGVLELLVGLAGSYLVIAHGSARWPVSQRAQMPVAPPPTPLTPPPRRRQPGLPRAFPGLPFPRPNWGGLRSLWANGRHRLTHKWNGFAAAGKKRPSRQTNDNSAAPLQEQKHP